MVDGWIDGWMDDYILLLIFFLFLFTVSFSTVPSTSKYNIYIYIYIYMYYINHTHKIHVKTIDFLILFDAVLYGLVSSLVLRLHTVLVPVVVNSTSYTSYNDGIPWLYCHLLSKMEQGFMKY